MGNTPSTEETAKKLARDRALTLPVGSKVEQLFYEDFDSTSDTVESSSKSASAAKKKQKRFSSFHPSSSQPLDKWAPISTASTGFSDPAHLSRQQARHLAHPLHGIPDKPLPAGPPIGPGPDFLLSPLDALSRSSSGKEPSSSSSKKHDSGTAAVEQEESIESKEASDAKEPKPKVSNETIPSSSTSTTYSAGESRWQERISRRIADRKVSDGVKAGLERTAYMGTELKASEKSSSQGGG